MTKKSDVDAMVWTVVERFGRFDIKVNNAGIGILGGDENDSADD